MYSKRRQPRKQKKSRSGLRKTQKGGGPLDRLKTALAAGQNMLADKINEYKGKLDVKTTEINDTINQFNSATTVDLKNRLRSNLEAKLKDIELLVNEAAAKAEQVKGTPEYQDMKINADKLTDTATKIKEKISALFSPRDGSSISFISPISVIGQIEQSPTSPTPTTSNDVETLQKRLDAIEPKLNNLNADFQRLLEVFTRNFHSFNTSPTYDKFKDYMRTEMSKIVGDISNRDFPVTGYSSS